MKNADAAISSKRSEKHSDDEERRKRKKKGKSRKPRRIRDSSPSSSPLSSCSDDSLRTRRKRAKRRKRDSKYANKKNKGNRRTSRKRRYRSVSASSSCSACRGRSISDDSSVSRSPSSKAKTRVRSRSRAKGRERDEDAAERGRSRRRRRIAYDDQLGSRSRSHSCSTCPGSSSPSIGRRADQQGRIFSDENFDEIEQPKRLRSVLALDEGRVELEVGIDDKDENKDKIIQTYDDFDRYDERARTDSYQEFAERIAIDDGDFTEVGELVEKNINRQTIENADVGGDLTCKKSDNSGGSVAVDLEFQLRQKALENFNKFRRSLSENTRSTSCQVNEASQNQSRNEAEDAFKSLDSKVAGSLELQENIEEEVRSSKPRVKSAVSIPAEEYAPSNSISRKSSSESSGWLNYSVPDSSKKGGSNLDKQKRIEETSNKMTLNNTSLIKDKQKMITAAGPGSSVVNNADESSISRQPTTLLSTHDKMESPSEKKVEDAGSQFQQKTFSRMHDGEMVQVSYKVYIPKKTPALARRQLQR